MNRRYFHYRNVVAGSNKTHTASAQEPSAVETGVRQVVQGYVDAREASDPKAIEKRSSLPDARPARLSTGHGGRAAISAREGHAGVVEEKPG